MELFITCLCTIHTTIFYFYQVQVLMCSSCEKYTIYVCIFLCDIWREFLLPSLICVWKNILKNEKYIFVLCYIIIFLINYSFLMIKSRNCFPVFSLYNHVCVHIICGHWYNYRHQTRLEFPWFSAEPCWISCWIVLMTNKKYIPSSYVFLLPRWLVPSFIFFVERRTASTGNVLLCILVLLLLLLLQFSFFLQMVFSRIQRLYPTNVTFDCLYLIPCFFRRIYVSFISLWLIESTRLFLWYISCKYT